MSTQHNQGDAKLKSLQANEKQRDLDTRDRNLFWIQVCFIATAIISFCFIVGIFKLLAMLFALSELYDIARVTINVFFGTLLIVLPAVGCILAKQIK